jgi:hypothetical protein
MVTISRLLVNDRWCGLGRRPPVRGLDPTGIAKIVASKRRIFYVRPSSVAEWIERIQ